MAKFMIGFSGCESTIILYSTVHLQQWKWSYCSSFLLFLHQHGAKIPLSNKVEGSENIELLLYHAGFVEESIFLWRRFLLLIVFKFHHTMLVLNAFLAISEGLVSDNQSSPPPHPPRDLPLRPYLVRLLVRSHHPVKKKNLATGLAFNLLGGETKLFHFLNCKPETEELLLSPS